MNPKPVIIIGNGGHAKVLTNILQLQRRKIIGFTAPTKETNEYGIPYLGNDNVILQYSYQDIELINAIGSTSNTEHRKKVFDNFKSKHFIFTNVIHPQAVVADTVELGEGIQIMAGVVIQPFVKIADNTIINTSSSIDHDCHIGNHCHIVPGVNISGFVTIGDSTHVGTGATIIQNINIGSNVLIGAGSVVLTDIRNGRTAYGIPAKEV